jgi:small subunit ribosomal protein S3
MMIYQEKLIEEPYSKYQLMKFLEKRLERAGLANVDIQRTPVVTRITLEVTNPARIIGKKGRLINELTENIRQSFDIENPQVSVVEVTEPFLEPRLVAKRAARYIEMGKKVRAVLHYTLREVIRSGALGAEIVAAGKIGAKGARAKSLRVSAGYIPKAGEPARLARTAHIHAITRSGIIGVLVRIVPPGTVFPDKKTEDIVLPKVIDQARNIDRRRQEGGGAHRGPPGRGGGFRRGPPGRGGPRGPPGRGGPRRGPPRGGRF